MSGESVAERAIAFEACFNFRDLGGYENRDGRTIRHGRLFRADTLHRLTDADLDLFGSLGLRTVIDLRAITEIDDFGRLRLDACDGLDWHHLPIVDQMMLRPRDDDGPAAVVAAEAQVGEADAPYARMFGDGSAVARAFGLLGADGALPAVFHCTSGKDRTGIISAMTLDLLGVPDEVIAEDYVLTDQARARSSAWIKEHEPSFAKFLSQIPRERRVCRPEMILGFLDNLRATHGSVEELLQSHGITSDTLDRIRTDLLEG